MAASESYPDDLRYHPEHDWARVDGEEAVLGITWYAQDALGEVVFFEPPEVGAAVTKDQAYTEVESVKAVSDVYAPLCGEVTAVNDKVAESQGNRYVLPHVRSTITSAWKRAGIPDVSGIDAIETHDCFTTSEYMAIDHFGLTPPGKSWQAIEEGVIDLDGQLPINPSGGLIGAGHPVGGTGVRQVLDAYRQVTDTAGGYQVSGAKKVATLNIGGSGTTSVSFVVGTPN